MGFDRVANGEELAGRVASHIERLRSQAGMTMTQVIEESGMSRTGFYSRLREETSWSLDDLARVAAIFAVDPAELLSVSSPSNENDDVLVDGTVLGRRIALLLAADGNLLSPESPISPLADAGLEIAPDTWRLLTTSSQKFWASRDVLTAVASFFGVDPLYLTDSDDHSVADHIEAQLELREALKASGAETLGLRALGDVSPSALRAIARSLRPGSNDHNGSPRR